MKGLGFELMQPPYFQLEEVVDWIVQTQFGTQADEWHSTGQSIDVLLAALLNGHIIAYGSVDASPVQEIAPWAWTEFEIVPTRSRQSGHITGFIVHSAKTYRDAALRDLSRRSPNEVAGNNGLEPGYHRVISQLVFRDTAVLKAFPKGRSKNVKPLNGIYARALREIDGGTYYRTYKPLELTAVRNKVLDYFAKNGRHIQPETAYTGLVRHYEKIDLL
jgi:hypothetical protein